MSIQTPDYALEIAKALHLRKEQVAAAIRLFDEGNTIPFIARYRKEMTGELDEQQLREIDEKLTSLRNLQTRKEDVYRLIDEQGKMTEELAVQIVKAATLTEVEDIYRPYRPKRKTRASIAREKGLEPLKEWLVRDGQGDVLVQAGQYISEERGVFTAEEALQGALDIFAEEVSDDMEARKIVRELTFRKGILTSTAINPEVESVYEQYYKYEEPVSKIPPHRILAINRGEREEILRVSIEAPVEEILTRLQQLHLPERTTDATPHLQQAIIDAYKRLIAPSVEREVRAELTDKADEQAIRVFALNLKQLLLQPPVRGKVVMGIDPAYRTGCKLAVVDETGKLLDIAVTYPTPPQNKVDEAKRILTSLIEKHGVEIIAIGNGTASRETELFVAELLKEIPRQLVYIIVSEAGASVYSASPLAREEFPDLDVAERSAISIARRLQDPLAELVKIDPKAVGVGQYQHDVSQKRLEEQLAAVVESAVNSVGVDVNTASASLLSYVSGLSSQVAKNIVAYREENGKFRRRKELNKVPRLGPKTYQQCIGFLRIPDAEHPFDNTPIHPESYEAAEQFLETLGYRPEDILNPAVRKEIEEKFKGVDAAQMSASLGIGVPTLRDIMESLLRPGRDPREELPPPVFRTDVLKIEDLEIGMVLRGTVRNIVDFGVFVDIGLKNDGLVHISQLADRFVRNPMDVVSVGDVVNVRVISVDVKKGRVGLSMRDLPEQSPLPVH
ncbi:RNA-binding transcriptional accessory protein [Collibacillus ludicampi]|uniref:RNA-binding transcriptional accessory protein n=1 Tax=Collibacillus ludicampi TaxID=2771369 RepID=A0AAV4LEV2_9BACL|nr:Tex family protein [Collibacillus ludicampi]GIM46298.1 RNA-binding transcriptional accessory protein [Collibacillus ludicampi]